MDKYILLKYKCKSNLNFLQLIMQLSKSKKQVIVLYISTILSVATGVLVSILNTRSLQPEAYGDVRYVLNLIAFFSGILLVGYFVSGSRLLALAKDRQEAAELKGGLVAILCILTIVLMLIMLLCGIAHYYVLGKSCYSLFYYIIPFCGNVLFLNYMNTTAQGDNNIYAIAAARLLPQIIYLIIAFVVYRYVEATSVLLILLQNGIYFFVLGYIIYLTHPSFANLKQTFRKLHNENKRYGLQVYYGSLANVSVQYIAGITLGAFAVNNVDVGFYSLALTISAPLATLPNVIATSYFKRFAVQHMIETKVLVGTFMMALVSFVLFAVLITPIVGILYSEEYGCVAVYAIFLAFASTMNGLADVYNRFLGAHGRGKDLRNSAWTSGAVAILGYTTGVYFWGIEGAIVTRILSCVVQFLMMFFFYKKYKIGCCDD